MLKEFITIQPLRHQATTTKIIPLCLGALVAKVFLCDSAMKRLFYELTTNRLIKVFMPLLRKWKIEDRSQNTGARKQKKDERIETFSILTSEFCILYSGSCGESFDNTEVIDGKLCAYCFACR